MIVDPWGRILAEAISGSAQITATMDPDHLAASRQYLPALHHRRFTTRQRS
jgi:predicted amidohydrolase